MAQENIHGKEGIYDFVKKGSKNARLRSGSVKIRIYGSTDRIRKKYLWIYNNGEDSSPPMVTVHLFGKNKFSSGISKLLP
jgi:hypothetical protein